MSQVSPGASFQQRRGTGGLCTCFEHFFVSTLEHLELMLQVPALLRSERRTMVISDRGDSNPSMGLSLGGAVKPFEASQQACCSAEVVRTTTRGH